MPTYGYQCLSCDNQFEVFQSIKDDPLTTCEACGGSLRKRVYPVGIAFKGSGFYVNDYAGKPAAKSEAKGDGGEAPSDAAKSDKPETKSETPKTEAPKADAPKVEAKSEAKAPATA